MKAETSQVVLLETETGRPRYSSSIDFHDGLGHQASGLEGDVKRREKGQGGERRIRHC